MGTPNHEGQYVCTEEEPVAGCARGDCREAVQARFREQRHQVESAYTFYPSCRESSNELRTPLPRGAEQPSKAYNPLFLYGGVGMGKTHLMHAIGHLIKKRNPAMRLSYLSAEKFTIEVINSLRFCRMITSATGSHTVDVLLVDDIQFIAGKERTRRVLPYLPRPDGAAEADRDFFRLSARTSISIERRLRSRFEWG